MGPEASESYSAREPGVVSATLFHTGRFPGPRPCKQNRGTSQIKRGLPARNPSQGVCLDKRSPRRHHYFYIDWTV